MDLQLGLAFSSGTMDKGFDLNSSEIEVRGDSEASPFGNSECNFKKRNFGEAFEEEGRRIDVPRTLPLLVWDKQGGDDLDDEADSSSVMNNNKSERNDVHGGVVGWPPLNPWRKKICQSNHRQGCAVNCVAVENGGGGAGIRGKNSMYVKVKMEGVGIARKVDLNLHYSYQTLLQTLIGMFGKYQESVQFYQLEYQDEEGDWQPVENVNWGKFKRTVQRLKLVRKG
ncbi:OLC1v1038019C1 [Oldenlandia corymbosa var. corymbosa]|uniref:Auxin-responsive protein n=1 Tax=Oldenlandia corymbosa var. corymbosa TaxID=529605 RepID=A0AAV1CZF8_OLDCO|nr:OLC1v1038019C1 [Oldenlandia corymbosa var. corymbosa]